MKEFDIKPPKTLRKDMERYLEVKSRLEKLGREGRIPMQRYITASNRLEEKYSGKIHNEDRLIFGSETEFKEFLDYLATKNFDNKERMEWTLKHEKEHYEAISKEPGIIVNYCFWALKEEDGSISGLPAIFQHSLKDQKHYLEVKKIGVEAVTEKSLIDELS